MKTKRPAKIKSPQQNDRIETAKMQVKRAPVMKPVLAIMAAVKRKKPKRLDEELFFQRMNISRRMNEKDRERILAADRAGDEKFFKRLAKTIKTKQNPLKSFSKVEQYLLNNWQRLHKLTDAECLNDVQGWCQNQNPPLHNDTVSDDSIKKTRQRLALSK